MFYIVFIFIAFLFSACTFPGDTHQSAISGESVPMYQTGLDTTTKIQFAKKRKNYISGIRKGDYYSLRNNPDAALAYYLQVAEKLPNDQVVRKKIAHVYYLQKNWNAAYTNFIRVPFGELSDVEKSEMIQSLFFDEGQIDRVGEVLKMPFSTGQIDYYRLTDVCYTGTSNCHQALRSYSGTSEQIESLRRVADDALQITSDPAYKNLVLAAKFYEQGMYGASLRITDEILKERPDYQEVSKIHGFSLFELGQYERAKKVLLSYLESNPEDLESLIRLGEIYSHLGDIVSSNLALNNAIIAGYMPKTDLERRLAYNYSLLSDAPGMMKVMNYLLQEPDVKEDDYAVGISFALSEGDIQRARNWAQDGLQKFKDSPMLTPLYIESLRLSGDRETAQRIIDSALGTPIEVNPNFVLQRGILLFENNSYDEAESVFRSLSEMEEWPLVVEEAQAYLDSITQMSTDSGGLFPLN